MHFAAPRAKNSKGIILARVTRENYIQTKNTQYTEWLKKKKKNFSSLI